MTLKKSAVLRQLEGNRGHRPIAQDELQGLGAPQPPALLTKHQLERWHEIVGSLPAGVLTAADVSTIERMAVSWATFREAEIDIQVRGQLVIGEQGTMIRNPSLLIRQAAASEMASCASVLGLSPYARTRLTAPEGGDVDPLELLLGSHVGKQSSARTGN